MIKKCTLCGQEKEHHAKGMCYSCYKKTYWKPTIKTCKRCGKLKEIHAKELCASCYNIVYHSENSKIYNQRKTTDLDLATYRKLTQKCAICDFDKIVDLHHIDFNKKNNNSSNLVGLCPNHHRMANTFKYRSEIYDVLGKNGYIIPNNSKYDFHKPPQKAQNSQNKTK